MIILSTSGCIGMASPQYESLSEHGDPLYVNKLSHSGCIVMDFPQYKLPLTAKITFVRKYIFTMCALIWVPPTMCPRMPLNIPFICKSFPENGAFIWLLPTMSSHMTTKSIYM